jgi:hypothetical protein
MLDNWIEQADPVIYIKEFYGMTNAEPCEATEAEGGLHLTKTGYLTRRMGGTLWNSNVLK